MTGGHPVFVAGDSNWSVVTALLIFADSAGFPDPLDHDDSTLADWQAIETDVRRSLGPLPSRESVSKDEAAILNHAAAQGPIGCHAAAWAFDQMRHHTFGRPWAADKELTLNAGEFFPVCDWTSQRGDLIRRMPRPWQTQRHKGDLPHVRRFRRSTGQPDLVFDGRYYEELAFLSGLRMVSVLAANADLDEFDVPASGFPIAVIDAAAQAAMTAGFVAQEVAHSDLLMLAELAGTAEGLAAAVSTVTNSTRSCIVLAGTRHEDEGGRRANAALLVLPSGEVIKAYKRTQFWDVDTREGIDACVEPIRVLVTGDVRLAVLVCKDFLVPEILDVVAHAGVNFVLVPSMSRRLDLHDVHARQLAARCHALSVVANGPLSFGPDSPASIVIGLPEADPARTVLAHRASTRGVVTRFDLSSREFIEVTL